MKKSFIFKIFSFLLAVVVLTASVSCDKDDPIKPDPGLEGSITALSFQGVEVSSVEVSMQGVTINVLIDMGIDIKTLVPVFTLSEEAELVNYVPGTPVDFSQPFVVQVKGSDGNTKTYQITVTIDYSVAYGIGSVSKVFAIQKTQEEWPFHAISGMAISETHLLVMHYGFENSEIKIEYYNALSGAYEGKLNIEGIETGRKLTTDSKGVILSSNVKSEVGTDFKIYKWNNVTAAPELFLTWTHDIAEHYGSPSKPWEKAYVGLAGLSVQGDLAGDAVIYAPISMTNIILRWTVTNGQLVSQTPEKINYTFDNGRTNWEMTLDVEPLGNKPTDDFILNCSFEVSLSDASGNPKRVFSSLEVAGANETKVFKFNNATFAAMWQNGWTKGARLNIFDITKPDYINNMAGIRETDAIKFLAWVSHVDNPDDPANSVWLPYLIQNTNGTGAVDVKVAADGKTAMVYFLATNAGIEAYELSVMSIPVE